MATQNAQARTPNNVVGDVAMPIPPGAPAAPVTIEQYNALLAELQALRAQQSAAPAAPDQAAINAAILGELQNIRAGQPSQMSPDAAAMLNDQAFNAELNSFMAKAQLKAARQRAERPEPLMSIATEGDQMSVHVHAWRVLKYAGVAVLVAAAGYGLFLLVKVGVKWVAHYINTPAA
jgi:hypothetical protein